MPFIRNVRVVPIINGSVVKYDYLDKGGEGPFAHREFIGTRKEAFSDDAKAMKRARELANADNNLDTHTEEKGGSAHKAE